MSDAFCLCFCRGCDSSTGSRISLIASDTFCRTKRLDRPRWRCFKTLYSGIPFSSSTSMSSLPPTSSLIAASWLQAWYDVGKNRMSWFLRKVMAPLALTPSFLLMRTFKSHITLACDVLETCNKREYCSRLCIGHEIYNVLLGVRCIWSRSKIHLSPKLCIKMSANWRRRPVLWYVLLCLGQLSPCVSDGSSSYSCPAELHYSRCPHELLIASECISLDHSEDEIGD